MTGSFSDLIASVDPSALPKVCSTCQSRYPQDFLVCPRDATPLTVEGAEGVDPLVGKVLGDAYQIVRVVGEGGMGRVYEARHLRLKDRRFAIKVLHPRWPAIPTSSRASSARPRAPSAIDHPNVVDVYDVHKTPDGSPYIVAEFLEGKEFGDQLAEQGRVDVTTAVHIARQVCRALAAAHAKGIVHRDMKPENVFLVQHDGGVTVKVLDFGISKAAEAGKANLTQDRHDHGHAELHAARASARRSSRHARGHLRRRRDALSRAHGQEAVRDRRPASTLSLVLTEEPPGRARSTPRSPSASSSSCSARWRRTPSDRFQTMEELDMALAPFDTDEITISPSPSSKGQVSIPTIVSKPADPNARTMMASSAAIGGDAKLSRPTIILTGLGMVLWLIVGVIDTASGVLRQFKRDGDLTLAESILLIVGSTLIALTPSIYFFVTVRRKAWNNSVRALELAGDLRRTFFAGAVSYGVIVLVLRMTMNVILRQSATLSSGSWDVLAFAASFVIGALTWSSASLARSVRKRRALKNNEAVTCARARRVHHG